MISVRTIHMLLGFSFEIFAKGEVGFRDFNNTMESVFQTLHRVGATVKHASDMIQKELYTITCTWRSGIIGDHFSIALVRLSKRNIILIRCHEINSHKINSHEINYHKINSHEIIFSRDQIPYDQLIIFQ